MHACRKRAECALVDLERIGRELPDGEERPADRQRRDHRVDAGPIGEAGVDHGRRLVDPSTDFGDDLVDHPSNVVAVDEADRVVAGQLSGTFHEHQVRPVDHDLGDVLVVQKLVDRSVAEDVVGDVLDQLSLVGGRHRCALCCDGSVELLVDPPAQVLLGQTSVEQDRAELVDQLLVDAMAQLVERRVASWRLGGLRRRGRRGSRPGAARAGRDPGLTRGGLTWLARLLGLARLAALLLVDPLVQGHRGTPSGSVSVELTCG